MTKPEYTQLLHQFQTAVLERNAQAVANLATARKDFDGLAQMQAYIDAYHLRLQGVVRKDYPALKHYVGEAQLTTWAETYVTATPSQGYNLNPYAIGFADWLQTHTTDSFAHALAQLEAVILRVYLAPDSPALTHTWLQSQAPDYLLTTPLKPRTAFALLALDADAENYVQAVRSGESATPLHQPVKLAICRHGNITRRHRLEADEYALLLYLNQGFNLADAVEKLNVPEDDASQASLTSHLQTWLQHWLANGFFQQP